MHNRRFILPGFLGQMQAFRPMLLIPALAGILFSLASCTLLVGLENHIAEEKNPLVESSTLPNVPEEAGKDSDAAAAVLVDADAALDAQPLVCEAFSCKPGCGNCEAGMLCGVAGIYVCGSYNCGSWIQGSSITCSGSLSHLFQCVPKEASADVMPNCMYMETSSGRNWYCCK